MGLDPATTLHDVRWGEDYDGQFVWVFEISGLGAAVPPHRRVRRGRGLAAGHRLLPGRRQHHQRRLPAGRDRLVARRSSPTARLHVDLGRGTVVELPAEETQRRKKATNPEWPIMHAVLHGVSRDQFMARHKANHIQVAYAEDADGADRAVTAKAAMFAALGLDVHVAGDVQFSGEGAGAR